MTTTRIIRAAQFGPIRLTTDLVSQHLTVVADPGRASAEVTVSTADDSGPSADAVNDMDLTAQDDLISVRLPIGAGATTIIQTGHGFRSMTDAGPGVVVAGGNFGAINSAAVTKAATVIQGDSPFRSSPTSRTTPSWLQAQSPAA